MIGTWKYDEPEVEYVTRGRTNDCVSYVLSYGQLRKNHK